MKYVIFDCDNTMGLPFKEVDDGLTLLYLLGRPDIEVLGITTTFGNGSVDQSVAQSRKLLAQVGRPDIPVYSGAYARYAPPTDAARFLAESAMMRPGEISLLATGPLGNLRGAAELDRQFFANLKEIACMGGYLEPLRIGKRNIPELNLSADPEASYQVLNADCPVTLMNAHVCLQAAITKEDIANLDFWPRKTRRIMRRWLMVFGLFCGVPEFYLWDLLPAVYLSHPDLFTQERVEIASTVKDLERGTLKIVEREFDEGVVMPSKIKEIARFMSILMEAWKASGI
ncbi:MAG: nucleoside hydrolase [Anaerolineaceae bacterium]|nr:nucleoside hydrolase [Anaerolineaceae bacterium]